MHFIYDINWLTTTKSIFGVTSLYSTKHRNNLNILLQIIGCNLNFYYKIPTGC